MDLFESFGVVVMNEWLYESPFGAYDPKVIPDRVLFRIDAAPRIDGSFDTSIPPGRSDDRIVFRAKFPYLPV
jgi:hypothetical protein